MLRFFTRLQCLSGSEINISRSQKGARPYGQAFAINGETSFEREPPLRSIEEVAFRRRCVDCVYNDDQRTFLPKNSLIFAISRCARASRHRIPELTVFDCVYNDDQRGFLGTFAQKSGGRSRTSWQYIVRRWQFEPRPSSKARSAFYHGCHRWHPTGTAP